MYADLYHATNPAAAAPPPELVPVQYADIKKQQVNTIPVQVRLSWFMSVLFTSCCFSSRCGFSCVEYIFTFVENMFMYTGA